MVFLKARSLKFSHKILKNRYLSPNGASMLSLYQIISITHDICRDSQMLRTNSTIEYFSSPPQRTPLRDGSIVSGKGDQIVLR